MVIVRIVVADDGGYDLGNGGDDDGNDNGNCDGGGDGGGGGDGDDCSDEVGVGLILTIRSHSIDDTEEDHNNRRGVERIP